MEYLLVLVVSIMLMVTNASTMKINFREKRQTYGNTQYDPNAYAASAGTAYDPALYQNNAAGTYQQQYGAQQSYGTQQSAGYGQQPSYSAGIRTYTQQATGYPQQAYGNQQPAYSGNQQAGYAAGNTNSYGYGR